MQQFSHKGRWESTSAVRVFSFISLMNIVKVFKLSEIITVKAVSLSLHKRFPA